MAQDSIVSGFMDTRVPGWAERRPVQSGLLASRAFWIGGLASAALWVAVAVLLVNALR